MPAQSLDANIIEACIHTKLGRSIFSRALCGVLQFGMGLGIVPVRAKHIREASRKVDQSHMTGCQSYVTA